LLPSLSPDALAQGPGTSQARITIGRDGKSAYSIYISLGAPASVKTAAEDLKSYFTRVAGFTPEVVVAAQPPAGPFISLGSTPAATAAGLDAATIPGDGYRIVTRGDNLFIIGPDTPTGQVNSTSGTFNGTSNGVSTFIEEYLGVRWLGGRDNAEEFTKLNVVEIPALDRLDTTPFHYRALQGRTDEAWQRHMKLGRNIKLTHSHNYMYTIPATEFDQHPEWFAEVGGVRVRPTNDRYKLDTLNPDLVQTYANRIIERFRKDPKLYSHSLSANDGTPGWSDSAATKEWMETDPNGKISRTPLILKFYNDVAKIVGKEFPDRKLGGYIYASFLFPPKAGIPKLEPNLALVLATSNSYGYQLLRPTTQVEWDKNMREWGEAAKAQGVDVYYYDLPLSLRGANGIQPTSPQMLNFIFSRVGKYGYKGGPVAGSSDIGNYIIAKLLWNPNLDAVQLAREYYHAAYGPDAAPHIEKMNDVLNEAFTAFYISHPTASYTLRPEWVGPLFGTHYPEIEKHYLAALNAAKEPRYRDRIGVLSRRFTELQQNLKASGALPKDYQSALTVAADTGAATRLPGTSNTNEIGEQIEAK
jgi:hypothetical protein